MNNKLLLLSANLKHLLSKEDMSIDSAKLLQDKTYATNILKKAMTSDNPKVLEIALVLQEELKINTTQAHQPEQPTLTEAQRLQQLKEKYKKEGSRN